MPVDTRLLALCIVEDAIHDVQYRGIIKPPAWDLRLALAYLYEIAGDDPGIAVKSRDAFDRLWCLATGVTDMGGATGAERMRSTLARTHYARIRRMVRFPESFDNDAVIAKLRRR